jgi:tRNA pseudouridine32 synthase/23S rRNA pseudouridine746 synthase
VSRPTSIIQENSFFRTLSFDVLSDFQLPDFVLSENAPHPLAVLAAEDLQKYLFLQTDWHHNFGLDESNGPVIGKMFGVLVVKTENGELGYLSAFSGKLAGNNQHKRFVPAVYNSLFEGSFLNIGMAELNEINKKITSLESAEDADLKLITKLKQERRDLSIALQQRLFESYSFLNSEGIYKNLISIFDEAGYKNPPSGAGECAAPKLLQYAFMNGMKPVALAEFWWGLSPKSEQWKHGSYYPCCKEKCGPILKHMLGR